MGTWPHQRERLHTGCTQVVWTVRAKHIHIAWCHHHGDLRPSVIILVCTQLACVQHHTLSQRFGWLLYPQGFGLVQFQSCTLYRGSCEKGKPLVITVAFTFCFNWNHTTVHAIDQTSVNVGVGVQLRCWRMSLCTYVHIILVFLPW